MTMQAIAPLLAGLFLLSSAEAFAASKPSPANGAQQQQATLYAPFVEAPPLLDASDACWEKAPSVRVALPSRGGAPTEIELKAVHSASSIHLLAKWPAPAEYRAQSPWCWDPGLQIYLPGKQEEECLAFYWVSTDPLKLIDIWAWRAGRSDPAGYADDLYATQAPSSGGPDALPSKTRLKIMYDSGVPCWGESWHASFAGETIPRFVQRAPSGSAADVKAKGSWSDGTWTLAIERLKSTKNADDIDIEPGPEIMLSVSPLAPGAGGGTPLGELPAIRIRLLDAGGGSGK